MALNGCEDAYLWTRNPRKTGIFQGLFPVATLLWSWVSGVRIPSLTPVKAALTSGFTGWLPEPGAPGGAEWGRLLLSRPGGRPGELR
jgi:hypothetical protein